MTSTRSRIKVVMLIGELMLGGSERQLYLLLKHLDKGQFESRVILFNPGGDTVLSDALESDGIEVLQLPADCKSVWNRMRFVGAALRRLAPDIVHSWTAHDNAYAGLIGRLAGVPVRFGSMRGSLGLAGFRSLPYPLRWLSLYSVSRLVVNSDAILQELVRAGYPRGLIEVLRNGVEIRLEPAEAVDLAHLGIQAQHRVVATVGNLREVKNHLMFVEGMARVLPQFPDVRSTIVGQPNPSEPALPGKIAARIRELGLGDRIALAGFCPDVPALMSRFAVFCLTSTSEGMPNVILEAMSSGRPVVATRVGGVRELVRDGVNGLLVESGDVAAFARAVEFLLKNPGIAERMGKAGKDLVQSSFSCEEAALRLGEIYREAVCGAG